MKFTDRQRKRLQKLEAIKQELEAKREKTEALLLQDFLPQHPKFIALDKQCRQLGKKLHQLHLQQPRKIQAAETAEQKARAFRQVAAEMQAEEQEAQAEMSALEERLAVVKQEVLAELRRELRDDEPPQTS